MPLMRWSVVSLAVFAAACTDVIDHGSSVPVVVAPGCRPEDDVSASQFHVTVFVDGGVFSDRTAPQLPTALSLPPSGTVSFGLEALDANGNVVGRGHGPTLVDDGTFPQRGDAGVVTFTLWPVGKLVRSCSVLADARRSHTATELDDGSLILAGGLDATGKAMSSVERLVLGEGSQRVAQLGISTQGKFFELPRAMHAAVAVRPWQVLFLGGQTSAGVSATALVMDTSVNDFGALFGGATPWKGRSGGHAVRRNGSVFIAGGSSQLGVSALIERIDLSTFQFAEPFTLPVVFDRSTAADTEEAMWLVGGTDLMRQPVTTVFKVPFAGQSFTSAQLFDARFDAVAVGVGTSVLVLGGHGIGPNVLATSEWLGDSGTTKGPKVTPRANGCAVALDEHRAFVVGGEGDVNFVATPEVVGDDGTVTRVESVLTPRTDVTCTRLRSGLVVVTGGRNASGPMNELWVYASP